MGPEAAMIQGGFGLLGGLIGMGGAQQANATAAQNFRNQLEHNYFMSSTAHQREVQDLKAAGLNPILSAGGSGAAVGGTGSAPTVQNVMEPLVSSALKGVELMNVVKGLDQADAKIANETKVADAQVFKTGVEASKIVNDMYMDFVKEQDIYENWKNWRTNRENTRANTRYTKSNTINKNIENVSDIYNLRLKNEAIDLSSPVRKGWQDIKSLYENIKNNDWNDYKNMGKYAAEEAKNALTEFATKEISGALNAVHSARKGFDEKMNTSPFNLNKNYPTYVFPYDKQK